MNSEHNAQARSLTKSNLAGRESVGEAVIFLEVRFAQADSGANGKRHSVIGHDRGKLLVKVIHGGNDVSKTGCAA